MKKELERAAAYALTPCTFGFCGPKGSKEILYRYLTTNKVSDEQVRAVLKKFQALYPYLKLIALSNAIRDPFNAKVIEAYWIGGEILEKVKVKDLKTLILEFAKLSTARKDLKVIARMLTQKAAKPHHSFHVFVVGSVSGNLPYITKILDLCRISWGEVQKVIGEKIIVKTRLIKEKKGKIFLGRPELKEIERDSKLLQSVKKGNIISFHWNRAVEVLAPKDVLNLEKYTQKTIEIRNQIFSKMSG
jgi:hypothetical protein